MPKWVYVESLGWIRLYESEDVPMQYSGDRTWAGYLESKNANYYFVTKSDHEREYFAILDNSTINTDDELSDEEMSEMMAAADEADEWE